MLLVSGAAHGQQPAKGYPTKQVRIVVPYPAGGPTDLIARLLAQKLGERLGQSFYVENVAGGFRNVIEKAAELARPGDVVLLSPACSSYDMFENYEDRGRQYRQLVLEVTA